MLLVLLFSGDSDDDDGLEMDLFGGPCPAAPGGPTPHRKRDPAGCGEYAGFGDVAVSSWSTTNGYHSEQPQTAMSFLTRFNL